MLQEIYRIQFNKQWPSIRKVHEIKVRVAVEHLRPQPKQHSPLRQQPKKGPHHNNKKEMRTKVIKTLERTAITNKDNVEAEMSQTTADQAALAIVDPVVLRQ